MTQEAEIVQLAGWAMFWYNLYLMAAISGTEGTPPVGMARTGGASPAFLLAVLLVGVAALMVAGGVWVRRRTLF